MKASEGHIGRVFVLQLEDGDLLPSCIEQFAEKQKIKIAQVIFIGGIGSGVAVVGPRISEEMPPDPMTLPIDGAHETAGLGLIAPDKDGQPVLHIHAALGRTGQTLTGCLRKGARTWLTGEAVICEILGAAARRLPHPTAGFNLLEVE